MRDVALIFFFAVLQLAIFRNPWIGALSLAWLSYMIPHRLSYGFARGLPLVEIEFVFTSVCFLISPLPKRFPLTRESVALLLFMVWISFTTLLAMDPVGARSEWSRAMSILAEILLMLVLISDIKQLRALVWVIVLSLGFYGVKGGLFTALHGGNYVVLGPEGSFIENNNQLAMILAASLPLYRYLALATQRRWVRLCLWAAMALTVLAVFGTYSRGGIMALAAVFLMMFLTSRHRVPLIVLALLLVCAVPLVMPQQWIDRIQSIQNYAEDGSMLGRLNAWSFAWNLAKAHPIFGGGFGAFTPQLFAVYAPDPGNYHDAHSIYFRVLANHGFPGLLLYLGIGVMTFLSASSLIRKTRKDPELDEIALLQSAVRCCLFGYAVGGITSGIAYYELPFHLVAITIICKVILRDRLRARASEAATQPPLPPAPPVRRLRPVPQTLCL